MPIPGDCRLRCVKCEAQLGRPIKVDPKKYGLVPNKHGAVIRKCQAKDCGQLWLGYITELPNMQIKQYMKKIDKEL